MGIIQIHNPIHSSKFTEEQVNELIPLLTIITAKYMKEREKLDQLATNSKYSIDKSRIQWYVNREYHKWKNKVDRLGGRVIGESGRVRFEGTSQFYFWSYPKQTIYEVHF